MSKLDKKLKRIEKFLDRQQEKLLTKYDATMEREVFTPGHEDNNNIFAIVKLAFNSKTRSYPSSYVYVTFKSSVEDTKEYIKYLVNEFLRLEYNV